MLNEEVSHAGRGGLVHDYGLISNEMSISAIARKTGMSRNTFKKHLREKKPSSYARKRRSSILDRILHHCTVLNIKGASYGLKDRRKGGPPFYGEK